MAGARFCLSFFLASLVTSSAFTVSPIEQVLNMLAKMKQKGEDRADKEKQVYEKYADWVGDREQELGFEIQASKDSIEKLKATITKADSDHTMFTKKTEEHKSEIESLQKELKAAATKRNSAHEDNDLKSNDLRESVDALKHAMTTVEEENYDRAGAEAYMQREATSHPGMVPVLAAFLQLDQPKVDAYKSQSGELLKTLKDLLTKFKGELDEVETAEINEARAFQLLELHISQSIKYEKRDNKKAEVEANKAHALSAKSASALKLAEKELAADEALIKEMKATLEAKTATYKENQKVRKEELEAISKAIEVISSPDVSGLLQVAKRSVVLLQSASRQHRSNARVEASGLLRARAKALASRSLAAVADSVAAEGPFDHVIKMMNDLLEKLKAEAGSEAEHHEWCKKEVDKNTKKRDEKTSAAEKHIAEIEATQSLIETTTRKIETLAKEEADLVEAEKQASSQREDEKADNEKSIEDAKAGIAGIEKALKVLKDFYESGSACIDYMGSCVPRHGDSFLELGAGATPKMKKYSGMKDSKSGVVGMLEVILSDFRRLQSDTEAAESKADEEHTAFKKANESTRKSKANEQEKLEQDRDAAKSKLTEEKDGLKGVKKELEAANKYYEDLKPLCVTVHVSFEERVAARNAEIEALKKAYEILEKKME